MHPHCKGLPSLHVPVCPVCNRPVPLRPGDTPDFVVEQHLRRNCQPPLSHTKAQQGVKRDKQGRRVCDYLDCKERTGVHGITCKECKLELCLKHRFPEDHACRVLVEKKRARQEGTGMASAMARMLREKWAGKQGLSGLVSTRAT